MALPTATVSPAPPERSARAVQSMPARRGVLVPQDDLVAGNALEVWIDCRVKPAQELKSCRARLVAPAEPDPHVLGEWPFSETAQIIRAARQSGPPRPLKLRPAAGVAYRAMSSALWALTQAGAENVSAGPALPKGFVDSPAGASKR